MIFRSSVLKSIGEDNEREVRQGIQRRKRTSSGGVAGKEKRKKTRRVRKASERRTARNRRESEGDQAVGAGGEARKKKGTNYSHKALQIVNFDGGEGR